MRSYRDIMVFIITAQKIWSFWIWSHLLKKSLMENFIFCAAYFAFMTHYSEVKSTAIAYTTVVSVSFKTTTL